jgi:hypothetical protein
MEASSMTDPLSDTPNGSRRTWSASYSHPELPDSHLFHAAPSATDGLRDIQSALRDFIDRHRSSRQIMKTLQRQLIAPPASPRRVCGFARRHVRAGFVWRSWLFGVHKVPGSVAIHLPMFTVWITRYAMPWASDDDEW